MKLIYEDILKKQFGEPYIGEFYGKDIHLINQVIEQGIDNKLQTCYEPKRGDSYQRDGDIIKCKISAESLPTFIRRLFEGNFEMQNIAHDIIFELDNKSPLEKLTKSYIQTALESSLDSKKKPLSKKYSLDDISYHTSINMRNECSVFLGSNKKYIGDKYEEAGKDFWLTRNANKNVFKNWPQDIADKLTNFAYRFGCSELYIGKGGSIYQR